MLGSGVGSLVHYRNGTGGVEKNDELERQWLEKGAELGDVNAQSQFRHRCLTTRATTKARVSGGS